MIEKDSHSQKNIAVYCKLITSAIKMATLNPTLLGFFGLTPNHIYTEEGSKGLRYLTEPSVDTLNLSKGYNGSNSDRAIEYRDKLSNLVT